MINLRPLARQQPPSPNVKHSIFSYFDTRGHQAAWPAKQPVRFEKRMFQFLYNALTHWATLQIIMLHFHILSFDVRKQLQPCIKNIYQQVLPECTLKIGFQSKTKLSSLFKFKNSIPKHIVHILLKFLCSCCNTTYYGQNGRHLFVPSFTYLGLISKILKNIPFDHS